MVSERGHQTHLALSWNWQPPNEICEALSWQIISVDRVQADMAKKWEKRSGEEDPHEIRVDWCGALEADRGCETIRQRLCVNRVVCPHERPKTGIDVSMEGLKTQWIP